MAGNMTEDEAWLNFMDQMTRADEEFLEEVRAEVRELRRAYARRWPRMSRELTIDTVTRYYDRAISVLEDDLIQDRRLVAEFLQQQQQQQQRRRRRRRQVVEGARRNLMTPIFGFLASPLGRSLLFYVLRTCISLYFS